MKKALFIGSLLSASLLIGCAGKSGENTAPSKDTHPSANIDATAENPSAAAETKQQNGCWKTSIAMESGFDVKVTPTGGVKVVFSDWNKVMDILTNVLCVKYPYDAPFKEEEIKGLSGKVTGVCVAGNPMSPNLYFQLEDGKVQMYSVDKMLTKWSFWAGSLISDKPVKEMKEVTEDFEYVVAEMQDGKIVKDDDFVYPMVNLSSYHKSMEQPNNSKYCNLFCEYDGSLTYVEYGPDFEEKAVYHGYISAVEGKNSEAGKKTFSYVLTSQAIDGKEMATSAKGQFSKESIKGDYDHMKFTPISGINIFSISGEKIGQWREVCNGNSKWE